MGVLDFSQDELDVGMKKVGVGELFELKLLKETPIRIRGEKENEIDIHYYLVLGDDLTYKVEFKNKLRTLTKEKYRLYCSFGKGNLENFL